MPLLLSLLNRCHMGCDDGSDIRSVGPLSLLRDVERLSKRDEGAGSVGTVLITPP